MRKEELSREREQKEKACVVKKSKTGKRDYKKCYLVRVERVRHKVMGDESGGVGSVGR